MRAATRFPLNDDEAAALADLLGSSVTLSRLTQPEPATPPGSSPSSSSCRPIRPIINRPLGDTKARTRTHVSIVAIVRGHDGDPVADARRDPPAGRRHHRRRHAGRSRRPRPAHRQRARLIRSRAMHETTLILIEVGALLLGMSLLGRLAIRIGISPIPFYLIVGLLSARAGSSRSTRARASSQIGAEIGVILLLALLGLEYTASELLTNLRRSRSPALSTRLLNAVPGAVLALLLGWGPVAAVALAGITWVSSSGVVAKMLRDLGRLGNRETPVVLAILVMEDLAMAFYLPVLSAAPRRRQPAAGRRRRRHRRGRRRAHPVRRAAVRARHLAHLLARAPGAAPARRARAHHAGRRPRRSRSTSRRPSARSSSASPCPGGSRSSRPGADPAARPLRRRVLRLLRARDRCRRAARHARARRRALRRHHGHEGRDRLLAPRRAGIGVPGRWRAGLALTAARRVLDRHRRPRRRSRRRAALAPLATAYVLITVILGPILARIPDARWFKATLKRRASPAPPEAIAQRIGRRSGIIQRCGGIVTLYDHHQRHSAHHHRRRTDDARRLRRPGQAHRQRRLALRPRAAVREARGAAEAVRGPRLHRARLPEQPVPAGARQRRGDQGVLLDHLGRHLPDVRAGQGQRPQPAPALRGADQGRGCRRQGRQGQVELREVRDHPRRRGAPLPPDHRARRPRDRRAHRGRRSPANLLVWRFPTARRA